MFSVTPSERFGRLASYLAAFLGFSIPISVALDNVLLGLIMLLWLGSVDWKRMPGQIRAHPVAISALALFALLAAGVSYGAPRLGEAGTYLLKYSDLLYVPIFVMLFRDARARELGLRWFCAAMILAFVVAQMAALGALDGNSLLSRLPGFSFKHSITHGVLSAYAAFLFALFAKRETSRSGRLLFIVLALVSVANVVVIGISRTGYLILGLLALYYFFALYRFRGLAIASIVLAALLAVLYGSSAQFRERVDTVVVDRGNWHAQWPSRESVTYRLDWYRHSLEIVRDHPLLGAGTGSFPHEYAKRAKPAGSPPTVNPHNEYLSIAVQTGLLGLVLMLNLFWQQLRLAGRLASPPETHLARGLVITMAVGCLFNSFLLDHTEGLFFAWLTGLLYGGLRPLKPRESAAHAP